VLGHTEAEYCGRCPYIEGLHSWEIIIQHSSSNDRKHREHYKLCGNHLLFNRSREREEGSTIIINQPNQQTNKQKQFLPLSHITGGQTEDIWERKEKAEAEAEEEKVEKKEKRKEETDANIRTKKSFRREKKN